ncbi:MAG: pilus assembly protein PilM [Methylophilaceae bacterium]|nr:pilus assembly protein PilM [Methylophilaceae bacterium]
MTFALKNLLKTAKNRLPEWLLNFGGKFSHHFSIGLDMGPDRLNLIQMHLVAGKPCVRAAVSIPYGCPLQLIKSDPSRLKALIRQAYQVQPFKGKRVVSCLSADQIKILTVSYKLAEGQQDAAAIIQELRERLKGDTADMIVDYKLIRPEGNNSEKREAIVAVAQRETVLTYLNLLADAGLEVEALDIGPAALTRLVMHLENDGTTNFKNVLLINIGVASSYLTVVWGRRLMLDRAVNFSENCLLARLETVLDMSPDLAEQLLFENRVIPGKEAHEVQQMLDEVLRPKIKTLVEEINKTLIYIASITRGHTVDKIYLVGRAARYQRIAEFLGEQLQVPVVILNPLAAFAFDNENQNDQNWGTRPGMALTAGLSLRTATDIAVTTGLALWKGNGRE